MCAEQIPLAAATCEYCGAAFQMTSTGYCKTCHQIRDAGAAGHCTVCGSEVMDWRLESKFVEDTAPTPPPRAQPSPGALPIAVPQATARKPARSRWLFGALAGLLILAAVGAGLWLARDRLPAVARLLATDTPTATANATPTLTPTPTPTLTPTTTPTITPTSTPTSPPTSTPTATSTAAPTLTPTVTPTPTRRPTSTPTRPPTATPKPAWLTGFVEPILASIQSRPPDFSDDFSSADRGWRLEQGEDFKAGSAAIEGGVMRFNVDQGSLHYFAPPALLSARQNFVLQFDARLVKGDPNAVMIVRFQHGPLPGDDQWGQFIVHLSPNHHWRFEKLWPGRDYRPGNLGAAVAVGETTQVTIIAGGSRFAILLNGKPAFYRDDPDFVFAGEIQRLFTCYAHSSNTVCEFDNVKFWKLGE